MPGKHWTPEEESFLRQNWHTLTLDELCRRLSRLQKAVANKAMRMGLGKKTYVSTGRTRAAKRVVPRPKPKKTVAAPPPDVWKPGRILFNLGWRASSRA